MANQSGSKSHSRVLLCGTYDLGKPRTRIMRAALQDAGCEMIEIHADVWSGIEDKSQIASTGAKLRQSFRWISAYPQLVWRYLRAPPHDLVIIPYLGHLDVLVIGALARLRSKPVVWDAFLSLHDTVIGDRMIAKPGGIIAKALLVWERLACRMASLVVLDTAAHARLFARTYEVPEHKLAYAFVGAEQVFDKRPDSTGKMPDHNFHVLFYGQFIPLHGVETIFAAAKMCRDPAIRWTIVGTGQEAPRIRAMLGKQLPEHVEWVEWVPYEQLASKIAEADLCLGIFGTSGKAARVIPNKVFQILAARKPLVTRDSPAIRELLPTGSRKVRLVPPGDPAALLRAVEEMRSQLQGQPVVEALDVIAARFDREALAQQWGAIVERALKHDPVK